MAKLNTRFRWDKEHRTHKIFLTCVLWVGTCCPTGTGRWSGTGAPGASSSGQRGARTSCTNTGTSLSSASSPPATTRCSTSGQYNNVSRPCPVGRLILIMFLIATSLQYHAMEDVGSVPLDLAPAISWHHQTASCGRPDSGCQVHHLITASSCQNNPSLLCNTMQCSKHDGLITFYQPIKSLGMKQSLFVLPQFSLIFTFSCGLSCGNSFKLLMSSILMVMCWIRMSNGKCYE